ncbi:MAG: cell wall hydrolase, partial [bacterium]
IAVGNVVLNRVKSEDFPDTVKEVILDRHYGIQFSPAYTKEIKKAPSESAVLAAKLCLEGANTAGESLYFASTAAARTCWAESHRKRYDTIGHQVFYI